MRKFIRFVFFYLVVLSTTAACSPIKVLDVSMADGYDTPMQKVMIITFSKEEYIREQFENVLSNQLAERGVATIPSYEAFPDLGPHINPEVVLAKAREMGATHILVAKSIHEEEVRTVQRDGYRYGYVAASSDHTSFYGEGFFMTYREDVSTYYNVVVNVYDVESKSAIWSYLSQLKIAESRQGVVNQFIPTVIEQLKKSKLLL